MAHPACDYRVAGKSKGKSRLNPLKKHNRVFTPTLLLLVSAAILAATNASLANTMRAASLPPAVLQNPPPLHQIGKGSHSYFGIKVYQVTLWGTANRWNPEEPHALDLESNHSISGDKLADAGTKEMDRLGIGTAQQRQGWRADLQRILPAVKSGDQLVIFTTPNHKTHFYYNGRDRGEIADPAFGAAFFSIWLDPRASNPSLRKSLLNH
jgi:hypothetical protein